MWQPTPAPASQWLLFTDLDGTLLDHHSYSFDAAKPALALCAELNVPVIFCTSKTRNEVMRWQQQAGVTAPFITENGAACGWPSGYFKGLDASDRPATATYDAIRACLHDYRAQHGRLFQGFGDMSVADIMACTGLDADAAALAQAREATEPLQWLGSEADYQAFVTHMNQLGYNVIRGGRFRHVVKNAPGTADKGQAMEAMLARYQAAFPQASFRTLALGDSDNDIPMLLAADQAVAIRKPSGEHVPLQRSHAIYQTQATGPSGWNEAVQALLGEPRS